jgi:4-amino-4-deoxy-L-arabinose transferase-like glycosyltransferase
MIVLTLGLGVLIFIFARTLFGSRTAVFAVALFSLEPTILGHGRVVQTDAVAAFGYLLFFMALYWYWTAITWRRAVFLGAAVAVAILAKYSMLLVGLVLPPAFIIIWWLHSRRRVVLMHAVVVIVTMLVAVNAAYFFQHAPLDGVDHTWISSNFTARPQTMIQVAEFLSYIVQKEFVLGIFFQYIHNKQGHSAGFLGMHSQTGWWYYFPVAFALKTTLPFLLLAVTSTGWATFRLIKKRDLRFMWLLAPTVIYSVFVLFSDINIGVRYLLPIFPFLIIIGAQLLDSLFSIRRLFAPPLVVLIFIWIGFEAIRAYPNHISYMNQIASRAPHWWYLSDSNVEWGDDLRGLALYLQQHGETSVADATLGGFGILRFYGIERVDPLVEKKDGAGSPRYLAIGASYLNGSTVPWGGPGSGRDTLAGRVNFFDAYRRQTPEAIIGNSIYVFRVR